MRAPTRTPTKHDPTTLIEPSNSFLNSFANAQILWEVTTVFLDRHSSLQRCWAPVLMVDGLRLASHLFCNSSQTPLARALLLLLDAALPCAQAPRQRMAAAQRLDAGCWMLDAGS
jgi:hypothetical protein